MKFALLMLSGTLLAIGAIGDYSKVGMVGAAAFGIIKVFDIFGVVRLSINYKKKIAPTKSEAHWMDTKVQVLEGIITLYGLISFVVQSLPGSLVFISSFGTYILCGLIVGALTDLPIKHGMGGWEIRYKNGRHKNLL